MEPPRLLLVPEFTELEAYEAAVTDWEKFRGFERL